MSNIRGKLKSNKPKSKSRQDYTTKQKSGVSKSNVPLIGGLIAVVATLFPTAPHWIILSILFWVMTALTSVINVGFSISSMNLAWYSIVCGLPFYVLLVPGLVLVLAYEEGRSVLASRNLLKENFLSVDLFISNTTIMTVIMLIVIAISSLTGYAQYQTTSIANVAFWFSISVLSPLFTYACARLAAASFK